MIINCKAGHIPFHRCTRLCIERHGAIEVNNGATERQPMAIKCTCGSVVKGNTRAALSIAYKGHRAVFHGTEVKS